MKLKTAWQRSLDRLWHSRMGCEAKNKKGRRCGSMDEVINSYCRAHARRRPSPQSSQEGA